MKILNQMTHIQRNEAEIEKLKQRFGWKCFATNTPQERLSLIEAVLCYRKKYRVERIFNRLKNKLNIAPYFVQKEDQITGMNHLLMLGVRVLSLIEFVVRRSLQQEDAALPHLHLENKKKVTKVPTAERLLNAFSHITLTRILDDAGNILSKFLTPLSDVQKEILRHLGLDVDIYHGLTN